MELMLGPTGFKRCRLEVHGKSIRGLHARLPWLVMPSRSGIGRLLVSWARAYANMSHGLLPPPIRGIGRAITQGDQSCARSRYRSFSASRDGFGALQRGVGIRETRYR